MSASDVLSRVESLYRETILTKSEVDHFRIEFGRLQEKVEKLTEGQMELRARLAVAEKKAEEASALRDRIAELEARFKASLDTALMVNAREAVGQHVHEFLRQNFQQILAAQSFTPGADGGRSIGAHKSDG